MFLPTRRPLAGAAFRDACAPPWHRWRRGTVARAERTADGRVHLVVVRAGRGGVTLSLSGVGAAQAENLAPVAARIRRALSTPDGIALRGTSGFEDAVMSLLDELGPSARARRTVLRLGAPCPVARSFRTMPEPARVLACPRAELARALGSAVLARRLQALARAFAAIAPCSPTRA